jgi:hypothetical protein
LELLAPTVGNIITAFSAGGGDYTTITAAEAAAVAGDTIYCLGSFTEAVATTKAGLRFINPTLQPHLCQWTSVTDTVTLTLGAADQVVGGIRFKPPTYTAGVPASIQLSSAAYAQILSNIFQGQTGSWNAIYSPVCNSDNVEIIDNQFKYLNTATYGAAILGLEAGGLSYSAWHIKGNYFNAPVTAVNINGRVCLVEGNHFGINGINAAGAGAAVCTKALDLSGTSSYGNRVHGNYLGGLYSATLYTVGASGDDWAGNFNIAGITTANPAP